MVESVSRWCCTLTRDQVAHSDSSSRDVAQREFAVPEPQQTNNVVEACDISRGDTSVFFARYDLQSIGNDKAAWKWLVSEAEACGTLLAQWSPRSLSHSSRRTLSLRRPLFSLFHLRYPLVGVC